MQLDLNQWPQRYQHCALTICAMHPYGGTEGTRTLYLLLARQMLSQLSYNLIQAGKSLFCACKIASRSPVSNIPILSSDGRNSPILGVIRAHETDLVKARLENIILLRFHVHRFHDCNFLSLWYKKIPTALLDEHYGSVYIREWRDTHVTWLT